MRLTTFLLHSIFISSIIAIIYEDQIGQTDWYKPYLGNFNFVSFQNKQNTLSSILAATDKKILASISPDGNTINWRHFMEQELSLEGRQFYEGVVYTIHGNGIILRKWDVIRGHIIWETHLFPMTAKLSKFFLHFHDFDDNVLSLIIDSQHVITINDYNGEKIFERSLDQDFSDSFSSILQDDNLDSVIIENEDSEHNFGIIDRICFYGKKARSVAIFQNNFFYIVENYLYGNHFTNKSIVITTLESPDYELVAYKSTKIILFSKLKRTLKLFTILGTEIKLYLQIDNVSAFDVSNFPNILILRNNGSFAVIDCVDSSQSSWIEINSDIVKSSPPVNIWGYFHVGHLEYAMITFEDESVYFFNKNGEHIWDRQESLATTKQLLIVDYDRTELSTELQDFYDYPINMFYKRIRRHYSISLKFLNQLVRGNFQFINYLNSANSSEFGIDKVLIFYTAVGKIFGIDSRTGKILWAKYIPENILPDDNVRSILFKNSNNLCSFVFSDVNNKKPTIYYFNPLNGIFWKEYIDFEPIYAFRDDSSASSIQHTVILDRFYNVRLFPNSNASLTQNVFFYQFDRAHSQLLGYYIYRTSENLKADATWTINISPNEKILKIDSSTADDLVNEKDIVLSDGRFLRKYINKNLLVVVSESIIDEALYIYLIDGVSGLIIDRFLYEGYVQPISSVVSQNWIIFSAWNSKLRRSEIFIIELYHLMSMEQQSNQFSSLNPSTSSQLVLMQAYVLPNQVSSISVTRTRRDITARSIILSFVDGVVAEIPKYVVDARRNISDEVRYNSIYDHPINYNPLIEITPFSYLSYYNQVKNVFGIETHATYFESTSIVVVFGQDIFYTLVSPSGYFDTLKGGFNYVIIAAVVYLVLVSTLVCRQMAYSKKVNEVWR